MSRNDEVSNLYKSSKVLEAIEITLFFVNAIMALINLISSGMVNRIVVSCQIIIALLYFVFNTVDDGHYWYIAEKIRRKNSIQNGLGIRLDEYETDGYYNNDLKPSIKRCAINTIESNFFSKNIAEKMIINKTFGALVSVAILIVSCVFVDNVNVLLIIAQTTFSSYIFVELIMLLLYKFRMESLYEMAYNTLILGNVSDENVAWMIAYIVEYEAIKAHYKVRLDEKIFVENNVAWSEKWQEVLSHRAD